MATCSLPYIQKLDVPQLEKTRLENLHFEIGRKLRSFQDDGTATFILKGGYLRFNSPGSTDYSQQLEAIAELNNEYRTDTTSPDLITQRTVQESYDPGDGELEYRPIQVVGIDVRSVIDPQYLETSPVLTTEEDSVLTGVGLDAESFSSETDLASNLTDFALTRNSNQEYAYVTEKHHELFQKTAESLTTKLEKYISLLRDSSVEKPTAQVTIRELEELLKALKNPESRAQVEAVSNFIVQSSGWLDALYASFSEDADALTKIQDELKSGINGKTGNPLSSTERDIRVNAVAKQLAKQKHYLYLFDELGRFREDLLDAGFKPKKNSTYERGDKLLQETQAILSDAGVSPGNVTAILELLASDDFSEPVLRSELIRVLSTTHPEASAIEIGNNVEFFMQDVLGSYPGKTAESILDEALSKAAQLKRKLVDQHYELVTNWIYPKVAEKQESYQGEFKLSRDDVKALLQQATKDEGFFQYQLDATIQSSDPINAVVASIVSDSLYTATAQTHRDLAELAAVRNPLDLEKKLNAQQREEYHKQFTHRNKLVLLGESGGEVLPGDGWEGATITVNVFGTPRVLRAYEKESFLEEFNTSLYEANTREFFSQLPFQIDNLWSKILIDDAGFMDLRTSFLPYLLDNQSDPYIAGVLKKLFFFSNKTGRYELFNETADPTDPAPFRNRIKSAYIQTFYSLHQQGVTELKKTELFTKWGITGGNGRLLTTESDHIPTGLLSSLSASKVIDGEEKREQLANPKSKQWLNSLVHYNQGSKTYVYVRKTRYNLATSQSEQYWSWADVAQPGSFSGVTRMYYVKDKLVTPGAQYYVNNGGFGRAVQEQWNQLQSGEPEKLQYFNQLYTHYSNGNSNTGNALKHGVLPQIEREQSTTPGAMGTWGRLLEWIKKHTAFSWFKDTKQWMSGEQEEQVRTGTRTYLDNSPVHAPRVNYTKLIDDSKLEGDLFRSVMMWKAMSNTYAELKQIDPQVQALRTLIAGDTFLGIDERQAKDVPYLTRKASEVLKQETSKRATNLNKKLTRFLDDIVYSDEGYTEAFMLGNKPVDPKKLAQKLSGFTAFSSLAWNISSMAGNIGVGFLNNYSESVKGKYYQPEDWRAAWGNYWKHSHEFLKDLQEVDTGKKSKLTQVSILLDGIQGEILTDTSGYSRSNNTETMMNRALYWTQSGAEHWIQTISMEAQMRGFKLESGVSLWDDVIHTPGEPVRFDTATEKELRQFQQQLHSVNKQLHGHYSQFDKSMLQRHWIGQMLMMFKKYIYSSVRYRFGDKRYDWEAGDETEGHVRGYISQMINELREEKNAFRKAAILGNNLVVKPSAIALDQLTAGGISNNSTAASQYLYGDESLQRNAAARQTGFDVLWYGLMVMMAGMIHAADEDDDPNGVFMQNMEAFARRMQGDLGMYLPFYLGTGGSTLFASYDRAWQLVKSPLAQLRAYDGSVNLLSQLIGFEHTEDGWDMSWNDTYSRDGAGYEKGDLKLYHKFEKSVLGPLSQINRLMNPESQLQFLNLSRRNSQ